jgi:hypothetical protein
MSCTTSGPHPLLTLLIAAEGEAFRQGTYLRTDTEGPLMPPATTAG